MPISARQPVNYPNDSDYRKATRVATDEASAFGIALYEGAYDPGASNWVGSFVGNTGDPVAAQHWVDTGELPAHIVRFM